MARNTTNLVVTKGSKGADLYIGDADDPVQVPSFAHRVNGAGADTTGAGDVFAAAMLIRYAATSDAKEAATYASACAALSTRAPSWDAVENPPVPFAKPNKTDDRDAEPKRPTQERRGCPGDGTGDATTKSPLPSVGEG